MWSYLTVYPFIRPFSPMRKGSENRGFHGLEKHNWPFGFIGFCQAKAGSVRATRHSVHLSNKIGCHPGVSNLGAIRQNPPFLCRVHKKSLSRKDISWQALVEVTGFEPATFWSRKMEGYPLISAIDRNYLIIPDRKATIRFSFRFAFQGFYGCQILNRLLSGIIQVVCSGMNLIFGFGLFDMPKNIFFQLSTLASFGK